MKPKIDYCFKELMNIENIRKGFLSALLAMPPDALAGTEILSPEIPGRTPEEKLSILDVRVRLQDGIQLDLEMQISYFASWRKRSLFYLTRLFQNQLHGGAEYDNCRKCIHVSILDFNLFPDDAVSYRKIHLREDQTGELYSDLLEIQVLELRKHTPSLPERDAPVQEWIRFFACEQREEFEQMSESNPYIAEAYDALKRFSADEKKRLEYEAREKALLDYNSMMSERYRDGWHDGHEEGRAEVLLESIRSLLLHQPNLTPEEAMTLLGIPAEKQEKYLKKLE